MTTPRGQLESAVRQAIVSRLQLAHAGIIPEPAEWTNVAVEVIMAAADAYAASVIPATMASDGSKKPAGTRTRPRATGGKARTAGRRTTPRKPVTA